MLLTCRGRQISFFCQNWLEAPDKYCSYDLSFFWLNIDVCATSPILFISSLFKRASQILFILSSPRHTVVIEAMADKCMNKERRTNIEPSLCVIDFWRKEKLDSELFIIPQNWLEVSGNFSIGAHILHQAGDFQLCVIMIWSTVVKRPLLFQ